MDIDDLKPVDIAEITPCAACGKALVHDGTPVFYRVEIAQCVLEARNVQTLAGMTAILGGNAMLAAAMSPTTTVAREIPTQSKYVCQPCLLETPHLATILFGE